MRAFIQSIQYYLPQTRLNNAELAAEFPEWSEEKIEEKTGIRKRHIAGENECASDLGCKAAERLFESGTCRPREIDFVLFCTQSPDYFLPTTACMVQDRLSIPKTAGALDINLGCSGYVYGLSLAKGLIETRQARTILFITAETYSKFLKPQDKSVRTIFGDAGAATLIRGIDDPPANSEGCWLGPFVFGTDGKGAVNLIVEKGGLRNVSSCGPQSQPSLYMNGSEIFSFTIEIVPEVIHRLLDGTGADFDDIDLFVFHQANKYILDHLRKKLKIPAEKFYISLGEVGNTVSASIPIALKNAQSDGKLQPGQRVLLVGFGVGYSWAAGLIRWR